MDAEAAKALLTAALENDLAAKEIDNDALLSKIMFEDSNAANNKEFIEKDNKRFFDLQGAERIASFRQQEEHGPKMRIKP